MRQPGLIELVKIHLDHQWRRGQGRPLQHYLDRFPELGPADQLPGNLIVEEYRARLQAGAVRGVDDYRLRFPDQFEHILPDLMKVQTEVSAARASGVGSGSHAVPLRGYRLIQELGSGAFATVHRAENVNGQLKALKIIREPMTEEAAQRERESLERVKNLNHPCLINTEDYWIENDRLHIVSELADMTLKTRLKQCQKDGHPGIPLRELFYYLGDAARGLDYLHNKGVVHRDVKPDNILLSSGAAKVADFGLVRKQERLVSEQSVFAGTMAYMAPEVFRKSGGRLADQYSLAITYAHLRQGELPFDMPMSPEQIMLAHLHGEYVFSDLIGPAERATLKRALSTIPTDRYKDCQALFEALGQALHLPFIRRDDGSGQHPPLPEPEPEDDGPDLGSQFGKSTKDLPEPPVQLISPQTRSDRRKPPQPPKWLPLVVIGGLLAVLGALILMAVFPPNTPSSGSGSTPSTPDTVPSSTPPTNPPIIHQNPKPSEPLKPDGATPDGTERAPDKDGPYAKWVTLPVNGQKVRFRFIPAARTRSGQELGPLYVMERKVSRKVFSGDDSPGAADTPAVGMSRVQAVEFIKERTTGGRLPTAEEWDLAAGFFEPRAELKKTGTAVTNVDTPQPTGTTAADTGHFDLLDMTGNGAEWTATDVPGTTPTKAITRGRNQRFQFPLTREILTSEQAEPMTAFADRGNKYTGFRVVIPAPPAK
jgi:serine/threonine protein kinase